MLKLEIPSSEFINDQTNEFVTIPARTLQLEHSLVSISKWESKWKKPFLSEGNRTAAETIDYIKCMTMTQNVEPEVYLRITNKQIEKVNAYINDSMTATTINDHGKAQKNRRVLTSELIYCWMFNLGIPIECQKWHLNRLLTLIKVCDIEGQPKQKMSRAESAKYNKALNASRKARMGTHG